VVTITTVAILTHRKSRFHFWDDFEQRIIDNAINELQNDCGSKSRPKDCTSNTCNFWHCTMFG